MAERSEDEDIACRREIEDRGWAAVVAAEVEAYQQEEYERPEREKGRRTQ